MSKKPNEEQHENGHSTMPGKASSWNTRYICWAVLILVILLTVLVRLRLLGIPLERDEGEYAYMGQLILQGIPPYEIAYNMKLPGTYAAYALIMLAFGQSAAGIHLGLIVINAATIILLFLIGERLFDRFIGLVAACSYAILSLSPTLFGTAAHATHFVLLPALAGILLMQKFTESGKRNLLFWSGFLLGLSFLMKQPGIFFVFFAFLYLLFTLQKSPGSSLRLLLKQGGHFLEGAVIPLVIACGALYVSGVFEKFWYWTVSYAFQYGTETPLSVGFRLFLDNFADVIGNFYLFWGLAVVGMGFLILENIFKKQIPFVLGFFLFSFLSVCPGFYFREHYFILLLPAVSLLVGIGLGGLKEFILARRPRLSFIPATLFTVVFLLALFQYRAFFFQWTPAQACRAIYSSTSFLDSIEIANYIKNHSRETDKIAVIGSEPQIYFYANRHSATGHIYTYALMEDQKFAQQMQGEMIEEVERAKPEYLVFAGMPHSWLIRSNSEKRIFEWFDRYSRKAYDLVGVIDLLTGNDARYRWGAEAKHSPPGSPEYFLVFKKKA